MPQTAGRSVEPPGFLSSSLELPWESAKGPPASRAVNGKAAELKFLHHFPSASSGIHRQHAAIPAIPAIPLGPEPAHGGAGEGAACRLRSQKPDDQMQMQTHLMLKNSGSNG